MNKRNILLTTITLVSLAYSSVNAQELTQKEKGVALLEKAFATKQDRSGLDYINEKKYIQHNLNATDGVSGLKSYLDYLNGKKLENKVLIAFEDNNYVVTLSLSKQEEQSSKVIDVFRFENGLIVEHWDNMQVLKKDENLKIEKTVDLNKTDANKKLVKQIIDKKVIDGTYLKNHMILAQGNFVLALNEIEKDNQKISLYELFDVKDSKIINTWNIEEKIPAINKWQNSNGKF
jgi:predicted SnoaL-like aldol condensation-catalyzing enzyme